MYVTNIGISLGNESTNQINDITMTFTLLQEHNDIRSMAILAKSGGPWV